MCVIVQMNPFERDMHRATADCEVVPVAGWTVPSSRSAKSASGATLVPASPRRPPHVTVGLKGLSSRLARSVRDPSGSGSGMSVAWRWRVGKRSGRILRDGAARALSPLVGEKAKS